METKFYKTRGKGQARRCLVYFMGLLCLSFGLMLCTKSELGTSAVISTPYAVSHAFGFSMTLMVFLNYVVMIFLQFLMKRENFSIRNLLQLPLCAVNSVLMGWFGSWVSPVFTSLWQKVLLLLWAIVMVGVGAAIMVKMEIVPQPPEGLSQVISEKIGKDLGFGKNVLDFVCMALAILVDLLFGGGKLISVGLGTVLAMILTGRVISVFNHFFSGPLRRFAGLENETAYPDNRSDETSNKEETI